MVLLGQTVSAHLFAPSDNPIGAVILVKGVPLRVIGTLVAKGQSTYGQDQDDLVMVPFSTAETKVLGVAAPTQTAATSAIFLPQPNPYGIQPRLTGFVNQIYVQARNPTQVQAAIGQVTATLVLPAPDTGRGTSTTSPCATSVRSPAPRREAARSWRCCSPPSPRSRSSSAASAS